MPTINAKIDDEVLLKFRDVIYRRTGLRKGDFRNTLEEAMLEYIEKYSESGSARERAKRTKSKR